MNQPPQQRHQRQTMMPGWDQHRLEKATVIIMGMGALGNAVAQALALAGVGRLILCDMDRIELTNLSRAPLFRDSDIGRSKVEAAAEALIRLAPGIQIETRVEPLETGVGLAELRDASLVLGCLDSRAARLELAGRCALVAAPWIDGATGQWSGEVRPWLDPAGACFGCGMDDASRAENDGQHSCRLPTEPDVVAATAPLSLLIGAQMALLALRFLMGLTVDGAIKETDGESGLVGAVRKVSQAPDPACPFHHRLPSPTLLGLSHRATVAQLLAVLPAGAVALAWKPFQLGVKCKSCGYSAARCGLPTPANCPQCGKTLRLITRIELNRAPADMSLQALGIAPREILAVRVGNGIRYIQLSE